MKQPTASKDRASVPDWRQDFGSTPAPRPSLALALAWALCGAAYVAYQVWLLPVLVDWRGSAAQEGLVLAAAERIRAGQRPYLDFFLPGAPGAPLLHALLGAGRESGRLAALLASCASGLLALRWSARFLKIPLAERALLAVLLVTWGFSQWNMVAGGWFAALFSLLALTALPRSEFISGAAYAAAFWFTPSIGGGGALGTLAWLMLQRDRRAAAVFAAAFLALTAPLAPAWRQVFFASTPVSVLPAEAFAAPLTSLGLWMLSLFFLRSDSKSKSARMVQLGVLAYAGIYASRAPEQFTQAGFMLLSIAAWPLSLALALPSRGGRARFLALWLPGFLSMLLLAWPMELARFLWLFPFSSLLLCHSLAQLHARYGWLPPIWARLPAIALLAGGIFLQSNLATLRANGARDSLGFVSAGAGQRLDEEVTAVWRAIGKNGEGVIALPEIPAFEPWTGLRNPSPYLSFPSGAGAFFGTAKLDAQFLVLEEGAALDPQLSQVIQSGYQERKVFPEHFTLYERRESRPRGKDGIR